MLTLVLENDDSKALLITKECVKEGCFHNNIYEEVTWEHCSLREELNGDFYEEAFSNKEKSHIKETDVTNLEGERKVLNGSEIVKDKVFLLSFGETMNYPIQIAKFNGKAIDWWVRSPGILSERTVSIITSNGTYGDGRDASENAGIRPAIWVKFDS